MAIGLGAPKGVIITAVGLLGACTTIPAGPTPYETRAEIKMLIDSYALARDAHDAVAYANCFAEDGILVIGGEPFQGRDAIRKRVEAADPDESSVHLMSTSKIDLIDATNAKGINYAVVFNRSPVEGDPETGPLPLDTFAFIGIYHDSYVLTDEGWKIAERRFDPVYSGVE